MEFTERSIILRVGKLKESDLWLHLLTPTRGLFSAFAFGGSKSRRRFSGCLDLFNDVLFHYKNNKQGEYISLEEGILFGGPRRLRKDWQRLGIAMNCGKFVEAFGTTPDSAHATHAIFSDLLQLLEEAEKIPPLLPIFFRARLAFEQGYAVDPASCSICGENLHRHESAILPLRHGGIVCRDCNTRHPSGPGHILSRESLDALTLVLQYPMNQWIECGMTQAGTQQCARALDGFIQHHAGLVWDNGRFVRS